MNRNLSAGRSPAPSRRNFSIVVLAGGAGTRIGRDKAFLRLGGRTFVSLIVEEVSKVAKDVFVVVGSKKEASFSRILPAKVSVLPDSYHISNPMGGMLTGFDRVSTGYAAVLACDLPLIRYELLRFVCNQALGHSAAVPIWENGDTEPLCAVYRISDARKATLDALKVGRIGPKQILPFLSDVRYVPVSRLRRYDPELDSLMNVNTPADYDMAKFRYRELVSRTSD